MSLRGRHESDIPVLPSRFNPESHGFHEEFAKVRSTGSYSLDIGCGLVRERVACPLNSRCETAADDLAQVLS